MKPKQIVFSWKEWVSEKVQSLLRERARQRPIPRYTDENFKFRGPRKKDGTGGQK